MNQHITELDEQNIKARKWTLPQRWSCFKDFREEEKTSTRILGRLLEGNLQALDQSIFDAYR